MLDLVGHGAVFPMPAVIVVRAEYPTRAVDGARSRSSVRSSPCRSVGSSLARSGIGWPIISTSLSSGTPWTSHWS